MANATPVYDWDKAQGWYALGWSDGKIAIGLGCHQTSVIKWRRRNGLAPLFNNCTKQMTTEDKRKARKILREGASIAQVAKAIGFSHNTILSVRSAIKNDPRLRKSGQSLSQPRKKVARLATQLLSEIREACRYVADPVLRDDVIAEMYLDLLEDRIKPDQIKAQARVYSSRAIGLWQSKFGPVSLDEDLTGDGFTLGDTIQCPHADAWLEEMGI